MNAEINDRAVEINKDGMFHINLTAFVDQNQGFSFHEFEDSGDLGDELKRIYELNNLDYSDKRVTQLWVVDKDYRCNNVGDHGLSFQTHDRREVVLSGSKFSHVPYQLMKDCKEGDYFDYIVKIGIGDDPNFYDGEPSDDSKKVLVRFHVRCLQQEYQYKRFGSVEHVVEKYKSKLNKGMR